MTTVTQQGRNFMHRVLLYDDDVTSGLKIAAEIEDDPRWELIALCTALGDLNFILSRVPVDVLLIHLTAESAERQIGIVSVLAREAQISVWLQPTVRSEAAHDSRRAAHKNLSR